MKVPEIPVNEHARVQALLRYGVLDTPPEERFDRITRIVAEWLEVPISLVSLVDSKRQWFKSRQGLEALETPREYAFCAHAIHGDEVLVVENALEDERFADNPLVEGGPEIRFYAGSPLVTPDGLRLGTLCAIDVKPRTLKPHQLALLDELAQVVVDELELTHSLELSAKREAQLQQQADDLKCFSHALAHDLQGPLRQMRMLCELAQDQGEFDQELLGHLADSAETADKLVNALRSYFEVNAPAEGPVEFQASESLQAACAQLTDELQACGGTVTHDALPALTFHAPLLTTLFVNFVGNAIKYRHPERAPEIKVSCADLGAYWSFLIADNGLGIEHEQQERVFELLVRLHRHADIQGSGIGLAICTKIVRMAGGCLSLESTPGLGSTFSFRLPKVPVSAS